MRTLIDGYNVMYVLGLLEKRLGPNGLRKARTRFLNDLAARVDAVAAHQTTVVFDAQEGPVHLPRAATHKGITILYADEDEGADARIETLIAAHSTPKSLTVVSTDHRIRQAAARRKARVLTAEAFWQELETPRRGPPSPPPPTAEEEARLHGLAPEEAARWLETFRDVVTAPETRAALDQGDFAPSDEEIRRITREVEDEDEDEFRPRG
jgi:predicted RNA-binding protein with PIN domain